LEWLGFHERVQFVDGNAKDPSSPVFAKPTLSNPNTDGALANVSDGCGLRSGDISSPGVRALLVEEMGEGRMQFFPDDIGHNLAERSFEVGHRHNLCLPR